MSLPIGQGRNIVGVGITIVAKVWAGVVLADVFRHDAAAGLALALVLVVIARFPPVGNSEKRIARNKPRTDEFHQLGVMRKTLHDEPVIDATIAFNATEFKVLDCHGTIISPA